jgi:membrane protease YdiL (CAAX protease family)
LNRPSRSVPAQIFISPDEPRLRAGWRIVLQFVLLFLLLEVLTIGVLIVASIVGYDLTTLQPLSLADLIPTAIALTLSVWIARRLLDRRSFVSRGFRLDRSAPLDVLAGFLIAGVMMAAIYVVEAVAGLLRFDGWAWQAIPVGEVALGLLGGLLGFTAVGFYEELHFRGYLLQNIRDGMGMRWGLFLSSVIFGISHLSNPNVTWYSTLLGLIAAGYFLAYGWVRTRQLWLSIGVHIGWNFFEGNVLGFPVSGIDVVGLIRQTPTGPVAITGGPFGPEAGLIILPAMGIGAVLIWLYTRGRAIPSDT